MSQEDINDITSNEKKLESVEDKENDGLMREYEEHISDFIPQHSFSLDIQPKKDEVFYEDVLSDEPVQIRGTYFIANKKDKNPWIDMFILDPTRRVIFSRRKQAEGIFQLNTTMKG